VVEQDETDLDAWIALGVAYRGQGKYDKAKTTWESVLAAAPNQPDALYDLGVLAMDFTRDEETARKHLARYLHVAPEDHPKRKDAEGRLKELGK
jgi:tetratricopeptide (TPR) repeat protein